MISKLIFSTFTNKFDIFILDGNDDIIQKCSSTVLFTKPLGSSSQASNILLREWSNLTAFCFMNVTKHLSPFFNL